MHAVGARLAAAGSAARKQGRPARRKRSGYPRRPARLGSGWRRWPCVLRPPGSGSGRCSSGLGTANNSAVGTSGAAVIRSRTSIVGLARARSSGSHRLDRRPNPQPKSGHMGLQHGAYHWRAASSCPPAARAPRRARARCASLLECVFETQSYTIPSGHDLKSVVIVPTAVVRHNHGVQGAHSESPVR